LDLLGFPRANPDFSMGYRDSKDKNRRSPVALVLRPLSLALESAATRRDQTMIARIPIFTKQMFKKMYGRQASPSPNGRVRNFIDGDPAQC
jgi:hypothetical protein